MANRPDPYRQLLERAATQATAETAQKYLQESVTESFDIPDPIAGTGLKALATGKVEAKDIAKQAVNYGLNAAGIPVAAVGALVTVFLIVKSISDMNAAATRAYQTYLTNSLKAGADATGQVMGLIENDLTQTEFINFIYDMTDRFATDAEKRKQIHSQLMAEIGTIRPFLADALVARAKQSVSISPSPSPMIIKDESYKPTIPAGVMTKLGV